MFGKRPPIGANLPVKYNLDTIFNTPESRAYFEQLAKRNMKELNSRLLGPISSIDEVKLLYNNTTTINNNHVINNDDDKKLNSDSNNNNKISKDKATKAKSIYKKSKPSTTDTFSLSNNNNNNNTSTIVKHERDNVDTFAIKK